MLERKNRLYDRHICLDYVYLVYFFCFRIVLISCIEESQPYTHICKLSSYCDSRDSNLPIIKESAKYFPEKNTNSCSTKPFRRRLSVSVVKYLESTCEGIYS